MSADNFMDRFRRGLCPNCGEKGPHFVPPCLGDRGFYTCDAVARQHESEEAS